MTDALPLPPLVPAVPEVPVEVWDDRARDWHPGFVTHRRGGRVAVRYSRGVGAQHLAWVPADAVRRV